MAAYEYWYPLAQPPGTSPPQVQKEEVLLVDLDRVLSMEELVSTVESTGHTFVAIAGGTDKLCRVRALRQ